MAKLSSRARKNLPKSDFALSGGRFPINDKPHDRAAIRLAPYSFKKGNITKGQERTVIRKAEKKLHGHFSRGQHHTRSGRAVSLKSYSNSPQDNKEDRFISKLVGMSLSQFRRTPEHTAIDKSIVRLDNLRRR